MSKPYDADEVLLTLSKIEEGAIQVGRITTVETSAQPKPLPEPEDDGLQLSWLGRVLEWLWGR